MDALIKNIDEEKWHFLKVEATKERVKIGELFNRLVGEYNNRKKEIGLKNWEKIFSGKPLLTKEEAKKMHKDIESFRKEYSFEG